MPATTPAPSTPISPYARLANALAEMQSPKADKINPAFKSKYCSLEALLDHVRPILAKHGLALSHSCYASDGKAGVKILIIHPEGVLDIWEPITGFTKPETNAQQLGSNFTYFKRQSIQAAFGISTDLDTDGNDLVSATAGKSWTPRS